MHLRTKFAALMSIAMMVSCATPSSEQEESLKSLLEKAVAEGRFYYAHQDDLMYGHTWHLEGETEDFSRSDVKDVCGEYPGMLGYDLGEIEYGGDRNLDGNLFSNMRLSAQQFHAKGGILTLSWHTRNPLTGGDAWDVTNKTVVESILPGGEKHELFMGWLCIVADYLQSLNIPVIFRPWHENSGSWFWWGAGLCTPEQYKQLWIMTYDYIVKERSIDNLVWAYSPGSVKDADEYMLTYPGDEYVDVMGFDIYDYSPAYIERMQHQLDVITPLAKEHGKILAVTETGSEGIKDSKWWTEQLLKAVEGYPVAYVLTWRNAWDQPGHFYGPWKGADCEEDFVKFYNDPRTIFVK